MHSNKKCLPCKVEHLESKGVVTSKSLIQYWWLVYLEWVEDSVEQQCLETKRPVILPKTHYVSKLILQHVHRNLGHAGRNHMLSTLQKRYWIINANSACRKVITECVVCRRFWGKIGEQKMADLPKERIMPDLPPFSNTCVDYFGPIDVKSGRSVVKRYGVMFTCMTSRAVQLEVAFYLDTNSCINCIRRFMCRRGQVLHLRSVNGTNFIGAQRELRNVLKSLDHGTIQSTFLSEGIKWTFNTPAGSHHGGMWERLIRLVKKVLYSTLQPQWWMMRAFTLFFVKLFLMTVLSQSFLMIRMTWKLSRQIISCSWDQNHFFLQDFSKKVILYIRRRWRQVQYLSDLFWKRWIREYLPLLQERSHVETSLLVI